MHLKYSSPRFYFPIFGLVLEQSGILKICFNFFFAAELEQRDGVKARIMVVSAKLQSEAKPQFLKLYFPPSFSRSFIFILVDTTHSLFSKVSNYFLFVYKIAIFGYFDPLYFTQNGSRN